MLDALARYQSRGRGRSAVMLVAREFAADKHDTVEVENLRRNLDRWRREKSGQCPKANSEAG
jgi:hypothetical protein